MRIFVELVNLELRILIVTIACPNQIEITQKKTGLF